MEISAKNTAGGFRTALPAYLALLGAVFFWSSTWVFSRAVWQDVTPMSLAFWRWLVALAVMLPLSWRELRAQRGHILQHWRAYLLLGITGVSFFNALVYLAMRTTTATNVSMISASTPVIIMVMSWLIYRETIRRGQAAGIVVSLVGVAVIITRGDLGLLLSLAIRPGDLWVLVAMLFWALYTVILRRKPEGLTPFAFLTVITAFGVAVMLPFFIAEWIFFGTMRVTPMTLAAVVYMAIFAALIAFHLWNFGTLKIGANRTGPFIHLMPVFTTLMAMAFLGERVHLFHLYGIALIFLGIFFASRQWGRAASPVAATSVEQPLARPAATTTLMERRPARRGVTAVALMRDSSRGERHGRRGQVNQT